MKDFSLLYGPVRTWLPVIAMAVLALVVLANQSSGPESNCDQTTVGGCAEPLVGERELLGNDDGLEVAPTGLPLDRGDDQTEGEPSPWDGFDQSDSSVPFVSLQPSPEPMTEAGEDLARSLPTAEGGAPNGP